MQFSNTVTIHRNVSDVFAFLEHFENLPKWNYAIVETRKTSPGPVGVGTTYEQTRSLPHKATEAFQVIAYEPDRKVAIEGDLGPLYGVLSYEVKRSDEGTQLTNSAQLEGRGISGVVAELARDRVRKAVLENLEKLKALLEA